MLCTTTFKILPFCSSAPLSARVQLMKTILGAFSRVGFHCSQRSYLNLKYTLETAYFENSFAGDIHLSPCNGFNMCNVPIDDSSKHCQNLVFTYYASNAISVFNERERLQPTDMHVWNMHGIRTSSSPHLTSPCG